MQKFVFIDLDDTLFQTLRKCGDTPPDALQVRAYLKDGSPLSYATPKQQALWRWLDADSKLIPVTARDSSAFTRVDLPFAHDAVINHGAVILNENGDVDSDWWQYITAALPSYQHELFAVWRAVVAYAQCDAGLNPYFIDDFGVTWYGVVKHKHGDEQALVDLLEAVIKPHPSILSGRLYWHCNGNNLAVLPTIIRKEAAVAFLMARYRQQHGELLTVGIGDSQTDSAFMGLCDYAMIPRNTQLGRWLHGD
jgi:hydroxymethylpyrimidine pyrophosphatase-like HAD family hydrolase